MVGDPLRRRVVLWEGVSSGPVDTWEWDGANWLLTSWEVALTPGAEMSITAEELIP